MLIGFFFKINDIKILSRFYHYRYHYSYTFFVYLLLHLFSSHRLPSNLFYIFSKSGACLLETGR